MHWSLSLDNLLSHHYWPLRGPSASCLSPPPCGRSLCGSSHTGAWLRGSQAWRRSVLWHHWFKEPWAPYSSSTMPCSLHFWISTYDTTLEWNWWKGKSAWWWTSLSTQLAQEGWSREVSITEAHAEAFLELILCCWSYCCVTASIQAPLNVPVFAYTKKPWPSPRSVILNKCNGSFNFRKDLGGRMGKGVRKSPQ